METLFDLVLAKKGICDRISKQLCQELLLSWERRSRTRKGPRQSCGSGRGVYLRCAENRVREQGQVGAETSLGQRASRLVVVEEPAWSRGAVCPGQLPREALAALLGSAERCVESGHAVLNSSCPSLHRPKVPAVSTLLVFV